MTLLFFGSDSPFPEEQFGFEIRLDDAGPVSRFRDTRRRTSARRRQRALDGASIVSDVVRVPVRLRSALFSCVLAAAFAGRAAADDCDTLDALTTSVGAARDAVDAASAARIAHGDFVTPLTSAHDALATTDALLAAATSPPELVALRKSLHTRLATALSSVGHAQAKPARLRKVRKWLATAAKAVARAAALLDRVAAPLACGVHLDGPLGSETIFPADNWWNADVSGRNVAANSDATIDFIGRTTKFHADFGTTFGIPYVVLDKPQPRAQITFGYDDESDHAAPGQPAGYPIPLIARTAAGYVEGGVPGGGTSGDRHLLLVDTTAHFLYEIYAARWTGSAWTGGSGAIFDLASNARRPDGWTSADAAGLAIFPGLVRADEVLDKGEITHALRFTVRATHGYVYPASHDATHGSGGDARPPLGLRVRMKAGVDLSAMSAPARVVFTAMKKYGLILADNGSDWYVTGAPDPRWDDEKMHDDFARITGNDFEVVE
jgi:hypothetical protein